MTKVTRALGDSVIETYQPLSTVSLYYKNADDTFVATTSSLGDVGASITPGPKVCYWNNPSQDRANVEIADAQVKVNAIPDAGNDATYTLSVTGVTLLTSGDGTGSQSDTKINYEIT